MNNSRTTALEWTAAEATHFTDQTFALDFAVTVVKTQNQNTDNQSNTFKYKNAIKVKQPTHSTKQILAIL